MIYYIDDFISQLIKAHNVVMTDQGKCIGIIKKAIEVFKPEDENILFFLHSACDIALDNPSKCKNYIKSAIDVVQINHNDMMINFNRRKKSNG
jgi:hypothetical protein